MQTATRPSIPWPEATLATSRRSSPIRLVFRAVVSIAAWGLFLFMLLFTSLVASWVLLGR